jgi:NitT/TauT family transport system substrate-binding protein
VTVHPSPASRRRVRRRFVVALSIAFLAVAIILGLNTLPSPRGRLVFGSAAVIGVPRIHEIAEDLGYFRDEGLHVEFRQIAGSSNLLVQVAAGQIDFGQVGVEPVLIGKQNASRTLPVRYFYNSTPRGVFELAVRADAGIERLSDLKGRAIGIFSPASSFVPQLKAILRRSGVDPDKDVTLRSVGVGASALHALETGVVDATALNTTEHAAFEVKGLRLKRLSLGSDVEGFTWGGLLAQETWLHTPERERQLVGFARAWAKASLFCQTRPDACIMMNWRLHPEVKPTGVSEAKALADARYIYARGQTSSLLQRFQHGQYGLYDPPSWQRMIDFMLGEKILTRRIDARSLYSNALIAQVNDFDRDAVIARARTYPLR